MQTRKKSNFFSGCLLQLILFPLLLASLPSSLFAQEVEVYTNLGLTGGQILDIAIDPSNPDKMFAASHLGDGLFMTTDGGISWQAVETNGSIPGEDEFKNQKVFAVKFAPSDSQVVWVAHNVWAEKSADGGATWTHILNSTMQRDCVACGGSGDDFRFTMSIAIDPADSQIVYAGTGGPLNTFSSGAVYKTVDGGATWAKMNLGNNFDFSVVDIAIDPNDSDVIWIVTSSFGFGGFGGTLYRSGDGGGTWSSIFSLTPFGGAFSTLAVKPNDSNTVFTGSGFGLIRHTFDGIQWNFTQPVPGSALVNDISFDPQDAETLYIDWLTPVAFPFRGDGIGKVGRSTDGGTTWETFALPAFPDALSFIPLTVHPSNSEILFAGDLNLGVYQSTDHGQTWAQVNNGINAVIVYDVAIDPQDSTHILAGTISGVYEKKAQTDWSRLTSLTTRSLKFDPNNSQIIYAGIQGFLVKTIDGGLNWTYSNMLADGNNYVSDIAIDITNTDSIYIAVASNNGIYGEIDRSTDGGNILTKVLDGVNQSNENYAFNAVAIDPADSQHIFAGGGNYFAPKIVGDLWVSVDGGDNWSRTDLQNAIINALLINPQDSNIMYAGAGYSGGTDTPLYKSADGGATWSASFSGIPGVGSSWNAVTDLEFQRQSTSVVYASTNRQGIYISPNQAKDWVNLGTPKYDVFAIATSSLYSATQGGLLQLTGTGLIYGFVVDSISQSNIDGAMVFTDGGALTISVNGEYIMISPAGIFDVTAIADGYANTTVENVTVIGGDVARPDISMQNGVPDPSVGPGESTISTIDENNCFIATAVYGSPLAKQVDILRGFRDEYLLPNTIGQKLVTFYYDKGEPAADYIESHPWLKPPVRTVLYPIVGFAWLVLSTTTLTKGIISFIIVIGSTGTIRRFGLKRSSFFISFFLIISLFLVGNRLEAATLFQQVGIASSPNPVGSGARAIGMGGAFIGIADDATAASWNPGGLIQLEKPEVSIVGGYYNRKETFSSSEHPEIDNTGTVDESNLNYFSAAYPFRVLDSNAVASINYQRLYEFKREFDYQYDFSSLGVDLMQDISFNQSGSVSALGMALAFQITPSLSVGVTLNVWTDQLLWDNGWDENYSELGVGTQGGVPVTINTMITDQYSQFRGKNANIGLLWDINELLTLGVVFKTPFTATLHHEFTYKSTSTFGSPIDTEISNQQSITETVELRMPTSFGFGLAFRVSDTLTYAIDIYYTDWSEYLLTDGQGNQFSPVDGLPKNESDVKGTTQVRFGVEYLFIGEKTVVPVRAGLFYDPEPSHGEVKDFYGLTIGSGVTYKQVIFDIAYQARWARNIDTGNLIATSKADVLQHVVLASLTYHY
jgi:long-subunit fatty acid transport protein/photosystem II stability/assembly factor-like uncharacterized protein